jgi:hypothetical protein
MDMRKWKAAVLAVTAVTLTACSNLDVPDLQRPSLSGLTGSPTPAGVAAAVGGVLDGARRNGGTITSSWGAYGREGWNLDPSNPQNINNVIVLLDPDAGSGFWSQTYADFRQANTVLAAVDAIGSDMTDAEKEGVRGFVKTIKAYELLNLTLAFDDSGLALDVNAAVADALPALSTKAEGYTRVAALLDEARTSLTKAGSSFMFPTTAGFADFNTPAKMILVNRAIRARLDIYTANYSGALTDLAASFLDRTAGTMRTGVYFNYGSGAGDAIQPVYDPATKQRFADQSFLLEAQKRADGTRDLRALQKVAPIDPLTRGGIAVSEKLTVYTTTTAPIPLIRNEELILLRAEARFRTGDRVGALDDINFIRVNSGGLAPITDPGDPGLLNEILYNRRYSLFWEQGVRWFDARRFNLWATLPRRQTVTAGGKFFPRFSLPRNECTQRSPTPAGCAAISPI